MNVGKDIKNCRRPVGQRITAKIEIALEAEMKDEIMTTCMRKDVQFLHS